ncbi:xanthine dehydrogenase family protein molybdopterin-binding subunit [Chryseobacterium culicis]|uniref:Isoquinoline 1-oxidoreductase, beta subunit n=1 Tax=Chryseobacterium culicis TaxID=680127 RepID=A0A1H6ILE4_CHRCI|nr:molybdopterin cofactor-binding domain-containing protein [Chryseobacterium culicis]SEH47784.1 isoquinoline 1-oxidoreductase, beta subunit [Chryseobacterium culicis]
MSEHNNNIGRRSFLKTAALVGGGLMLQFSWPLGGLLANEPAIATTKDIELNSYIKILSDGRILLFNPNPEFGQNVKTSLPMMLAEELDADWATIIVEQADFYPKRFDRQFTGGSRAMQSAWKPLRTAGATARQLLILAAAKTWNVPAEEITTDKGAIYHRASGKNAKYGEMASTAATIAVPKDVPLKNVKDFKIIGTSKSNVEISNIITGKPLFTSDFKVDGMLYAMIIHPPAFGMQIKSFDSKAVLSMPGIKSVFEIETVPDTQDQNTFDVTSFNKLVVIAGNSTWQVMQAKKALKVEWEKAPERTIVSGGKNVKVPAGLESTDDHRSQMEEYIKKPGQILRKDGNPEEIFKTAAKVIERSYTAPFLAHNAMEPVNCFAHFKGDKVEILGPIQAPELISGTIATRLGISKENVQIRLSRMGGGFGRRAYGHHMVEAAVISKHLNAPVRLVYMREDEMTAGIYRPSYGATFRAALDKNNNMIAYHVKAGGIPESPISADRFPAGAVDHYIAESWKIDSNITIGAFRAPRSNFMGTSEQSFLDEVAFEAGKDPIEFRLELLDRAAKNPVGKKNDYVADRYAGVLKLVKEKSNWGINEPNVYRGVSAYFCHNTYAAEVIDIWFEDGMPKVKKVTAAIDCGVVVNVDAAKNMVEGAITDAIGNALFGELPFKNGQPEKNNFNTYRLIRNNEAPREIDVHFVKNEFDPTGLGEPPFPPAFASVANALYKATGKRFYNTPFINDLEKLKKS